MITRGKLPQNVEKEDADFRSRLKKVQNATKKTLSKDNEGVKGFWFYEFLVHNLYYRYHYQRYQCYSYILALYLEYKIILFDVSFRGSLPFL